MAASMILYIGTTCPYCKRVTDYLKEHPLKVPIQIKDVWTDEAAEQALFQLAGRTQVPCLQIGEKYMHESLDIIQKLQSIEEGAPPTL